MREFQTPMMQQYMDIKRQYPGCLLFFRLGDFYELFLDDAEIGSRVLGITLTARPRGKDGHIPMAGVPFHAADTYLTKLVNAGYKVAICEQVSEPDKKGIVEREVVRVVTPGTILTDESLHAGKNNYLCAVSFRKKMVGCALADISTGAFYVTEFSVETWKKDIDAVLLAYSPTEILLSESAYATYDTLSFFSEYEMSNVTVFHEWDTAVQRAEKKLEQHFKVQTVAGFGLKGKKAAQEAAAATLEYVVKTQKIQVTHLQAPQELASKKTVALDRSTIYNLELFATIREGGKKGSLLETLDTTKSAMGARLLRKWIVEPLATKHAITARLDAVEELAQNQLLREKIQEHLRRIYDIERITARFSVHLGVPPELVRLKHSLSEVLSCRKALTVCKSKELKRQVQAIDSNLAKLVTYLDTHIVSEPRVDVKKGGVIARGVSIELDELHALFADDKSWIETFERTERERTGITSLKVKSNKVFGYYIEVSKSYLSKVPSEYLRKQTLVNAERFITPELKKYEEKILTAEEKIEKLEVALFEKVVAEFLTYTELLQQAAHAVAHIDCIASFAQTAGERRYVKPTVGISDEITISEGRHPVVETIQERGVFVPNDTKLNASDRQLLLITGPNMAGKSVYMRQVALIVLLAHIGSFVPARRADISLVDRLFVRSGASDFITSGMSTFMVEMVEAATILNHATSKSLIIMDEIGRGTSTFDGISIAWAIAEYLVSDAAKKPKTLFATHYHELQQLEQQYSSSIKNVHMAIDDTTEPPTFLHTVLPGGASHSFGVAVAKMAGVPTKVTKRAEALLAQLEDQNAATMTVLDATKKKKKPTKSVDIVKELQKLDINDCTPLQALEVLSELQAKVLRTQKDGA